MITRPKTSVTRYSIFALRVSDVCAKPSALVTALTLVALWGVSGPFCHWSDTWQLIINTSTTIVNFLLAFIILNAQQVTGSKHDAKIDRLLELSEEQARKP